MYFSSTFFTLVHLSTVLAIHPSVLSNPHRNRNHSLDHLQYRIPRALIDTCLSLDPGVSLNAVNQMSILEPLLAPLTTSAAANLCLCLKDLDIHLEANTSVQVLTEISALLAAVIDTSPDSRQCDLPPNAKRSCTNSDPCHWTCETNFVREDDACVCSPPNRICNGQCSESCSAIPSSVPLMPKAKRKRQQSFDSFTRDAVVYATSDLLDQLASLLKLAIELKLGGSRISKFAASYEANLYPVLQNVAGLLTSSRVADLLTNTNHLLDSISASLKKFSDGDRINSLGLRDLVTTLEVMHAGTVSLKRWLATNPIGTIGTGTTSNPTASHATMSNSPNMPIVLNFSSLLDSPGLKIDATVGLKTVDDLLRSGLGKRSTTASDGPLLKTSVAINLGTLLDSVLRLVLDANDIVQHNTSLELNTYVDDIAKATGNLVDSILDGRPSDLELLDLLNFTVTAKDASGPSSTPINLDLDCMLDALEAMAQQPPSVGNIDGSVDLKSLLNDLGVKRLRIDNAVKSR